MSKGMLGNNEALRRIMSGPLCDLAIKLNGQDGSDWEAALAKFLRKEPVWANGAVKLVEAAAAIFAVALGDGRSAKQLLKAGKYDWVSDYARQFVEGKEFRLATAAQEADLVLVEFDHDPSSEEVLAKFAEFGLERPTAEDALRFGEKFPDEQKKYPLVFLHEPWQGPHGGRRVLVLDFGGDERKLYYSWFDLRWRRNFRFVARRPRKS